MNFRRMMFAIAGSIAGFATVPATAQSPVATAPDPAAAFADVLANPTDVDANLRYARAAERAGQTRKALVAYERIVAANPDHAEARRELARLGLVVEAPFTRFRLGVGGAFDSNAQYQTRQLNPFSVATENLVGEGDVSATAWFRVDDERMVGDLRWRSKAQVAGDFHVGGRDRDFHLATVETGPMFGSHGGTILTPAAVVEFALGDYRHLFTTVGVAMTAEFPAGPLKRLRMGLARAWFEPARQQRDGWSLSARAEFAFSDVFAGGDSISVVPFGTRYDGSATTFEETYIQPGIRLAYVAPVASNALGFRQIFLVPELLVTARLYDGAPATVAAPNPGRRTDLQIVPGARLIASEFLDRAITAIVYYEFDRTRSNYAGYGFDNHRAGFSLVFEF